jgi:hypothetical protein
VLGIFERGKTVKATVIADRTKASIQPEVRSNVDPGAQIFSDKHGENWQMPEYAHEVINHLEAYVQGNVHSNGLENFLEFAKALPWWNLRFR